MKKNIVPILLLLILVCFSVFQKETEYPEGMIYNYMTSSGIKNMMVSTDNYVVFLSGNEKIIYNKSNGKASVLAQTVFDMQETGTNLIGAKGDLLYYVAIDDVTGGSAIYEFNLKNLDKTKIDTFNKVSNAKAFLGIDTVLGINNNANDLFNIIMNGVWFSKNGRHNITDIKNFLVKMDVEDQYGTDVIKGVCTTDDYIFFLNGLCTLYKYTYTTGEFKKITKCRVTDFFITDKRIYYYSADNDGELFVSDYNGDNNKYVTQKRFTEVHVHGDNAYARTEKGKIYVISNSEISFIGENIENNIWDTDEKFIYTYDFDTKNIVQNIVNLKGGEKDE